ncbi:FG-GAP-like repeat-containing protein [Aquabacterium sp.]|uniref:FG-GAP-like repeat-containing protein n=1 Tax=Aquabacterium sp. TaxID=1872578 RepID=UPI0024895F12|nr:FG-GAP-like repeat-containing protein [Aquabacterium sp.]MDI1257916.1 FG-GAP-like repeat-containing protein [Aquabacterium sp.]
MARDKAVAWLIKGQQPDGRWSAGEGLDVQATSAVVEALIASSHTKLPQFAAAVSWLQNAEAGSTDALARQVMALKKAGADVTALRLAKTLQDRRNAADKGWGAYPGYRASVPDTPLAMMALKSAGLTVTDSAALGTTFETSSYAPATGQRYWLHRLDALGGSPGEAKGEPVLPTALTVLALQSLSLSPTARAEAVVYLKAKQGASGTGQGAFTGVDGLYTPLDTALAGSALVASGARSDAPVQAVLDYLKRSQSSSGDWGDALSTALALQLVGSGSTAVVDTDGDGTPDSVEAYVGTDATKADGKQLASANTGVNTPANQNAVSYTYSGLRGKPVSFKLPVADAATCCTITSGALPPGVSLVASGSPLVLKLSGSPTEVGGFSQRFSYKTAAGVEKVVQLRLEIEPTLFRVDADPYDLPALFASDAGLNKLKAGWQAVVDDFNNDGRQDIVAYFSGANEAFNRLNCSPCTSYAGPDWGQITAFQNFGGSLAYVNQLVANVKFTGDLKNLQVVDFNNDGKKDLVLNLNKVVTTSTDAANKSTLPFRPVVLLRNDTPAGGVLLFTDVTVALKLDTAPDGDVVVLDANKDGVPDFVVSNGNAAAKLYVYNNTLLAYEDKSASSGLGAAKTPVGFNVDADAFQTIDLVSLDAATGIKFYRNNGNSTFSAVANETSLPTLASKRINRIVPADVDGDGKLDLVMFETATQGTGATEAYAGSLVTILTHGGLNASLQPKFVIRPDATLAAVSNLADAVNRGGLVADVDDDGRLDIVVSAKDVSATQLENTIFKQQLDGIFVKVVAEAGFPTAVTAHDSPVYVDLDDDGKADLFWPNSANTGYRLINEGNLHHAIDVIVKGKAGNRSALGAQVQVTAAGQTQTKQVLAQHAATSALHFGLGNALGASIVVKWPDGTQKAVDVTAVDRVVTITQP